MMVKFLEVSLSDKNNTNGYYQFSELMAKDYVFSSPSQMMLMKTAIGAISSTCDNLQG